MEMNNKKIKSRVNRRDPYSTLQKNSTSFYKTSDLYLSAFLKSKGIILNNIARRDDKVFFLFKDEGNIQDLVKEYFNDASVRVLTFKAALTDLRSIIFNYKKS
jgi:hypothetical protein